VKAPKSLSKSVPPTVRIPRRPSTGKTSSLTPASRRPPARRRANPRRRRSYLIALGATAAVLVLIAALIVVKATGKSATDSSARTPVSAAALNQLSQTPVGSLVTAANTAQPGSINLPSNLPATVPALTSAGKPEILYVGAEYCPYCAAERCALVIALSHFGTFSNLSSTMSSSTDANPDTPTFSFLGSTYSSPYLSFTGVEIQDRAGKTLQTPTATEANILQTYDTPPYTSTQGAIPFIDLGGRYLVSGTEYDGSQLSGMSFNTALADITSGASPTSRAVEAVAAHLIGVISSLTHGQPSSVSSAVPASLQTGQAVSANQGSSSG
jgi:thiol-disulfide isomerase/thioredoxin